MNQSTEFVIRMEVESLRRWLSDMSDKDALSAIAFLQYALEEYRKGQHEIGDNSNKDSRVNSRKIAS
jgi:hypothetical protein